MVLAACVLFQTRERSLAALWHIEVNLAKLLFRLHEQTRRSTGRKGKFREICMQQLSRYGSLQKTYTYVRLGELLDAYGALMTSMRTGLGIFPPWSASELTHNKSDSTCSNNLTYRMTIKHLQLSGGCTLYHMWPLTLLQ